MHQKNYDATIDVFVEPTMAYQVSFYTQHKNNINDYRFYSPNCRCIKLTQEGLIILSSHLSIPYIASDSNIGAITHYITRICTYWYLWTHQLGCAKPLANICVSWLQQPINVWHRRNCDLIAVVPVIECVPDIGLLSVIIGLANIVLTTHEVVPFHL